MTNDDKIALKEFATGVSSVVFILLIFTTFLFLLNFFGSLFTSKQPSTEVVGKYKECDIIRWNRSNFAEYEYFLYYGENK